MGCHTAGSRGDFAELRKGAREGGRNYERGIHRSAAEVFIHGRLRDIRSLETLKLLIPWPEFYPVFTENQPSSGLSDRKRF